MLAIMRNLIRIKRPVLNQALLAMLIVAGLYTFTFGMFSPLYALFVEDIGGGIRTASNAWALYLLTTGVLTFLTGRWENRIKQTKNGLILSQFLFAFGYLLYYLSDSPGMLYATQIVIGIGTAFFYPAYHALYSKHTDKYNAPRQWSFYDALGFLVPSLSAFIGGWLVKSYGFQLVFLIMMGISLCCGFYILILPKRLL